VSALQQVCASQPLLAQASFVAGGGGDDVSAALQRGACAVPSPGPGQPPVAQASLVTGCDALQHVSAGGGSLLPSMLLNIWHRSAFDGKSCSQFVNHRSGRRGT